MITYIMRLNDLKNFIEISDFKSLNLAAKKLEVTQPALSESLKRLENDLGVRLFYRTKNGISITPEGRKCLETSKTLMGLVQELKSPAIKETHNPIITVGCHPVIGNYFLPRILKNLEEKSQKFRASIKHGLSREILEGIQSGGIDIGLVVNPMKHKDLIIKKVATDRICIWESPKITNKQKIIADTDLFQTQSLLKKWKYAPQDIITSSSLELVARITDAGLGYGILPERLVKLMNLKLNMVASTPTYTDEFYLIYRPEFGKVKYQQEIIHAFKESVY